MALSFSNVERAYEVFNALKNTVLPQLTIDSWPEDMSDWSEEERKAPRLEQIYGFSKMSDGGWENLVFFVKNPSQELKEKFDELKGRVGNSSINKPYSKNKSLWIFGWF